MRKFVCAMLIVVLACLTPVHHDAGLFPAAGTSEAAELSLSSGAHAGGYAVNIITAESSGGFAYRLGKLLGTIVFLVFLIATGLFIPAIVILVLGWLFFGD